MATAETVAMLMGVVVAMATVKPIGFLESVMGGAMAMAIAMATEVPYNVSNT